MKPFFLRHSLICCWCLAVAVLPFVALRAEAQKTCGGIEGRATSPQGWLIPKATILFVNKSSKQKTSVETDERGEYTICLSAGMYDVIANAIGYKSVRRKAIQVDESSKATIDFVLKQSGLVDRIHP